MCIEKFDVLSDEELMCVDGGGFWDGLALVGASVTVGATGVAVVAAAPAVGVVGGIAATAAVISGQLGVGTGIALMFGAKL